MVLANRVFLGGSFPNRNVTFFIEEVVRSGGLLDVGLVKPTFMAEAVGITTLGNITFPDSTIKAGYYQTYNLRYSVNETNSSAKFDPGGDVIAVTMTAMVTAPLFGHAVQNRDLVYWNWTTVTKIWESCC